MDNVNLVYKLFIFRPKCNNNRFLINKFNKYLSKDRLQVFSNPIKENTSYFNIFLYLIYLEGYFENNRGVLSLKLDVAGIVKLLLIVQIDY